jgi:hypothetical protein
MKKTKGKSKGTHAAATVSTMGNSGNIFSFL